ncbi:CRISPR-associated endoribonuclease Cas6 [Alkalitalea saponilacus]|uniref:CRISPR-associated endoribonuclease Cas6 n=1 Tax=Alkalitalea saponilacus TaxID=889453 RepID=A0A1T5HUJ3_9BACT|nr:CRISPR-associated endoribonuclease Cas6 [Alkalitalea saponilacus]ASB49528.1 CRISPR-associated endoribonuclease Cas6 [Alkalitalea saponilacus]SKC24170.1 CRISPR-associated endoribonuclease Cas6 [Alkalitalea saponilacus]
MRLHFKIKSENQIVPFNHQHLLTGVIHKWLGWNQHHGELSLYSFSRLEGGKKARGGLVFKNGSHFFFSTPDEDLAKTIIKGVQKDPKIFNGLIINEIIMQPAPDFTDRDQFYPASPIFIKRYDEKNTEHIIYDDPRANQFLIETLERKMQKTGLTDDTLDIQFDLSYHRAGTKLVTYKNIKNRASWCPVIIKGKPETKAFAWEVGLGNSTGVGFGAVK